MMVTTIIGFILFIFSPISFVILFPEIFKGLAPLIRQPTAIINSVNAIHELVLRELLIDFGLMAFGLGLLLGCSSAIGARAGILQWFRSKTSLKFPIYTYGHTWDHLLMRVKSHGRIVVKLEESQVEGQLVVYSVKDEPKQIILRNYSIKVHSRLCTKSEPEDELLITDLSKIKEITVPASSFNLHRDLFTHTTQSFYTSLSALGLLAVSTSFTLTAEFLSDHTFTRLSTTYRSLSFILLSATCVMILISDSLYKRDFSTWPTAAVCYPTTLLLNITTIFSSSVVLHHFLMPDIPIVEHFLWYLFWGVYSGLMGNIIGKRIQINKQFDKMHRQIISILTKQGLQNINNHVIATFIDQHLEQLAKEAEAPHEEVAKQIEDPLESFDSFLNDYKVFGFPKGFLVSDKAKILTLFQGYLAEKESKVALNHSGVMHRLPPD